MFSLIITIKNVTFSTSGRLNCGKGKCWRPWQTLNNSFWDIVPYNPLLRRCVWEVKQDTRIIAFPHAEVVYPTAWAQNCRLYKWPWPAAFHTTVIDLFTPAWCWSQHYSGVMTPFSPLSFFPILEHLFWLLSAPPLPDLECLKLWEPPVGTFCLLVYMVIFYSGKKCGDSSQYKKWVIMRERPPWQCFAESWKTTLKKPANLSGQFDLRYNKTHVA